MNKKGIIIFVLSIILIGVGISKFILNNRKFIEQMREKYADNSEKKEFEKKDNNREILDIIITINNIEVPAKLYKSETGLEVMSKLPLNVTLEDQNKNEKFYYFNEAFLTNSSVIRKIEKGDIMIYSNNCLVLFYKDHTNITYSYTKIGHVENVDLLDSAIVEGESQKVSIRLAN